MSLEKIGALYRTERFNEALAEVEIDLKKNPECPYLWLLRGHLVQLSTEPAELPLDEAERSYLMACKLHPDYMEALEDLAEYYYAVANDKKGAKEIVETLEARIGRLNECVTKISAWLKSGADVL